MVKGRKKRKKANKHKLSEWFKNLEFSKQIMSLLTLFALVLTQEEIMICSNNSMDPSTIVDKFLDVIIVGLPIYLATSTVQKIDRNNRKGEDNR